MQGRSRFATSSSRFNHLLPSALKGLLAGESIEKKIRTNKKLFVWNHSVLFSITFYTFLWFPMFGGLVSFGSHCTAAASRIRKTLQGEIWWRRTMLLLFNLAFTGCMTDQMTQVKWFPENLTRAFGGGFLPHNSINRNPVFWQECLDFAPRQTLHWDDGNWRGGVYKTHQRSCKDPDPTWLILTPQLYPRESYPPQSKTQFMHNFNSTSTPLKWCKV